MLQKITELKVISIGFVIIILFSIFSPKILFPLDILNYLPLYSEKNWQRPHNSLLADPVYQFEPWRTFTKERLSQGEIPLWNKDNGLGTPFLANPQTAVLYPLNVIYYLFPVTFALNAISLIKIFLFGTFSYFYFRSIHIRKSLSFLGAITLCFSGFFIVWLLWPHTNVFIFFPLVLFLTEMIRSNRKPLLLFYLLISISYCMMIFGGHPETLFLIGIFHGIYCMGRLYPEYKKIIQMILSIGFGFCLGAITLIPFLEYLVYSNAFHHAIENATQHSISIITFIVNVIPFLAGAPHLQYYKSLGSTTNFQEYIGGYTGLFMLLIASMGILKLKQNIVKVWVGIIFIALLISYKVFSFSFASLIPFFGSTALHRSISFSQFGIVTLFLITITFFIQNKSFLIPYQRIIKGILIVLIFVSGAVFITSFFLGALVSIPLEFIRFVALHALVIFGSTFAGISVIQKRESNKSVKKYLLVFLGIPIIIQTVFQFGTYNSFSNTNQYYPTPQLITVLKTSRPGVVLDIGSLNFPPNLNLIYNITHLRSDDAIGVKDFQSELAKGFPIKNQWNTIDEVSFETLKRYGVSYVISDYDIRLNKTTIQGERSEIIRNLWENPASIQFTTPQVPQQLRILPATFNRLNSCLLGISIKDKTNNLVFNKNINCENFRDGMFYTIPVTFNTFKQNTIYTAEFVVKNGSNTNTIGLWTDKKESPYLEVLTKNDNKNSKAQELYAKNSLYLFYFPQNKTIDTPVTYTITKDSHEQLIMNVFAKTNSNMVIKKVFYPGWIASIDGKRVNMIDKKPFIKITIPQGKHIVELVYKPFSFYLGAVISILSWGGLLLIALKGTKQYWNPPMKRFIAPLRTYSLKLSWWKHGLILFASTCLVSLVYIAGVFLFSIHFSVPPTTAINWYTVNNYPKQQDSFYFYSGFIFIFVVSFLSWGGSIWYFSKKK